MARSNTEDLSQYVSRLMREKGFSVRDVWVKSKKRIGTSYVNSIVNGNAKNLSVEKLKALAVGLEADEGELFGVARGQSTRPADNRATSRQPTSLVVLDLRKKVVISPDVAEILQEVLRMSQRDRAILLQSLKAMTRRLPESRRGDKTS